MKKRSQSHHGYTLIELLVITSLCMFLILLASKIFMTSTKVIQTNLSSRQDLAQLDAMVEQLREDVWRTQSITILADQTLSLQNDAVKIQWAVNDQKQIQRIMTSSPSQKNQTRNYPAGLAELQFNASKLPGGILLNVVTVNNRDPVTMYLHCKAQILEAQHAK